MATIIPNGFGLARHVFNLTGRPTNFVVTMGYQPAGPILPNGEGVAAEAIAEAWSDDGSIFDAGSMVSAYTYLGCEVTEVRGGEPFSGSASRNIAGTNGGSPLPPNVAFIVTKRTTRGGRKGRGRMFLPPILMGEQQVDGLGSISDAVNLSIYQGGLNTALGRQITAGYQPVLFHADGSTPSNITQLTLQRTVATQRRRLR